LVSVIAITAAAAMKATERLLHQIQKDCVKHRLCCITNDGLPLAGCQTMTTYWLWHVHMEDPANIKLRCFISFEKLPSLRLLLDTMWNASDLVH